MRAPGSSVSSATSPVVHDTISRHTFAVDEPPQSDLIPEEMDGLPLPSSVVRTILVLCVIAAIATEVFVARALRHSNDDAVTLVASFFGLFVFGIVAGIVAGALRWKTSVVIIAVVVISAAAVAYFALARHWIVADVILTEVSALLPAAMVWPGQLLGESLARRGELTNSRPSSGALSLERVPSSHRGILFAVRLRRRNFVNVRRRRQRIRRILALRILRQAS